MTLLWGGMYKNLGSMRSCWEVILGGGPPGSSVWSTLLADTFPFSLPVTMRGVLPVCFVPSPLM